ncbi:TonB-dependent siderophore receptor [Echinicola strongylocentroti]|uniref:TonB-dependent siderophore receptor n=1 Tax=Echinicola strongylocentroti TaxID=1795355 RepID=A0A2Z4IHA7_9BACT|nr:TonB-dependent receptor [Echinicola strongylocentroti]AWW30502.1 TonB-dependent siderophore receptor [Echinicola strongylocentroti]
MKNSLLFLFLLSLSTLATAQTGKLKGTVTDQNGERAQYVNVLIEGTGKGILTDRKGAYVLENVPTGEHTVKFSSFTYSPVSRQVVIKEGQTVTLDISVEEDELQLQTVEIIGRAESSYKNTNSFIGTKSSTPLRDVPQSIGYVTKELALDQGAYTVNDVVKNVSGVNQFTFYNDITIRGHRIKGQDISGNLVNGMRAFTSFWKQQLIPHIERVEVIKGPASALFGNASAGGTINRVTKKPLKEKRQSISSTVGSFNTFRMLGDFTGPMTEDESLLYRLNLGYENSGSFRDLQYAKNLVVAPSFSFLPSENTMVNFDVVYQKSDGMLDRGQAVFGNGDLFSVPISKSINAVNDYLKEESLNITISLTHQITDGLSFNSVFMRSDYSEDLQEHRGNNKFANNGDGSLDIEKVEMRMGIRQRSWSNNNFSNYFNYDFSTGDVDHKLLVGYDYFQQTLHPGGSQLQARGYLTADRTGSINSYNADNKDLYALDAEGNPIPVVPHFDLTDPYGNQLQDISKYIYTTNSFPQSSLHSHGVYIQEQMKIGKLKVLLGLRQDYYTDVLNYETTDEENVRQNALIPRVGLVYSLSPRVNLYGTFVQGYQPQTATVINSPEAGGPFDPLTSELKEIGAKSDWFDGRLSATVALYYLTEKGALYNANEPGNPDLLVQTGKDLSKGVEIDLAGKITDNWSVVVNYAYNEATVEESDDENLVGRQKPNAPKHAGNLWTKYIIGEGSLKGLGFGLGGNFVTERFGSLGSTEEPPVFPGYELVNAAVYYKIDKFQIQMNINNIFDKTHWVGGYDYIRAFPGAPRNVMTTVSYTF